MEYLTKLLLFLGQQHYIYHRDIFFIGELLQFFASEQEARGAIDDPIRQGWLRRVDDNFIEITPYGVTQVLQHWHQDVYRLGSVGGGVIRGNPQQQGLTIVVEFDTPLRFNELNRQINYCDIDITLNCPEGYLYNGIVRVNREEDFDLAEAAINRYLSHLSFHFKVPVKIASTHSGSIALSTATRRDQPRNGIYISLPNLQTPTENQSRALAFYRQYRNFSDVRTTESRYYQLMSLLKIVEGVNPDGNLARNRENFVSLIDGRVQQLIPENQALVRGIEAKYQQYYSQNLTFANILWEHYRHGIVHWRVRGFFLDPDFPDNTIGTTISILAIMVVQIIEHNYQLN